MVDVRHRLLRIALPGILLFVLALVAGYGGAGVTGEIAPDPDLFPDSTPVVAFDLTDDAATIERDPVVSAVAAASVSSLDDRTRVGARVPTPFALSTSTPLYVRHCAFLC